MPGESSQVDVGDLLVDVLRRHTGRSIAPYASNATVDVIANAYENLDDTD